MKHTFKLSLLCSAILLAGCGDNTSSSGTTDKVTFESEVQALLDRGTSISFTIQGANADVPALLTYLWIRQMVRLACQLTVMMPLLIHAHQ